MNPIDRKVAEIWEKVYEKNSRLMIDWVQSFSKTDREGMQKSKEEIKMTLTQREHQTDPKKNFLWRLMSNEPWSYGYMDRQGYCKQRSELAVIFIQVMMENSYWREFTVTTLGPRHLEIDFMKVDKALSEPPSEDNLANTTERAMALHNAALLENVDEVRKLLEVQGERMTTNKNGFTPLHYAAMAIHPQSQIAKLLINSDNGNELLNNKTNDECGGNTALHIAAANTKVTEEFIQQFKDACGLIINSRKDTPFHVAAKSHNHQALIYMLNTFCPKKYLWIVDIVDKHNTLIKLCARKGNAAAVALLIEHGADIADGVLHEIVLESVRNPRKIENLKRVYHSVVDNVVTWRNLRKPGRLQPAFLLVMGSDEYEERYRKTMFWLLLKNRRADYRKQNVLECALIHGAFAMVWEIIHTRSVFRLQGDRTWPYAEGAQVSAMKKTYMCSCVGNMLGEEVDGDAEKCRTNWTVFDITNFTEETYENGEHTRGESAKAPDADEDGEDASERTPLRSSKPTQQQNAQEDAEPSNAQKIVFEDIDVPEEPYLSCLLSVYDQWENSNILSTQPFSELIQPYITLIQHFYFVLGLLQLIFMLSFTVCWMPTTCFLALMFNVSATGCVNSAWNISDNATPSSFSQQRSSVAMLWLIWPLILFSENVFLTYHFIKQSLRAAHTSKSKKMVSNTRDLKSTFVSTTLRTTLIRTLPVRAFCFTMFVWLYVYFWSESHESYVQVTSMVLLFGWITNVSLFGAVSKSVSISMLVLQRVIEKDVSGFMLFFGFSVIGFSFATHTIRMSICMNNQIIHLHETFFAVLSSAFGIGDFFDSAITDSTCVGASGSTQNMFGFVYLGYVCATMIILLNILIAMINNRYKRAKRKAENVWRFEMVFTMTALKSLKCFGCRPKLTPKSYHYNKVIKRHYLLLPVPVDEQLKTVASVGLQSAQIIPRSIKP